MTEINGAWMRGRSGARACVAALIARVIVGVVLAGELFAPISLSAQSLPPSQLQGAVDGEGPDGESFRIPGVRVRLTDAQDASQAVETVTDERGVFSFSDLQPGTYGLRAELDGFAPFSASVAIAGGVTIVQDVRLVLGFIQEDVVVVGTSDRGLQPGRSAPPAEVQQQTMQQVPIASEQYQSAVSLVPGVVRGPDGRLSVSGGSESQGSLRVNNANVADPVTGEFAFRLPIEAVRSVQVVTSPYAAEYGHVSGGVTRIETNTGAGRWRVQAQNMEPRLRRRDGQIRGIESWTPRFAVGGPLAPDRLTVFHSFEYRFTQTRVEGLPALESDTKVEGISAFTQFDWTASPSEHVSAAVALFPQKDGFLGLDTFNPQPTTPNRRQRGFLLALTDRRVLGSNAMLESHGNVTMLDTNTFPSVAGAAFILAPTQNSGSYFNSERRDSGRYEGRTEYSVTPVGLPSHLLKVGVGITRDAYAGQTESRPVVIVRADGSRAGQIDFAGPAHLSAAKTELLAFIQDVWTTGRRLTLDYGLRYDRDTIAGDHHLAPRVGVSFAPVPGGRTVLRGGAGRFYDKITLNAATFERLPVRTVTRYDADGVTIAGAPRVENPALDPAGLANPASVAWNVSVDRELTSSLLVRAGYRHRRGTRELIVDLPDGVAGTPTLALSNAGASSYREVELTARLRANRQQLVVSYVRSAASGDLNDVNSYLGGVANPIIRPNEYSRLALDAPNRVLAWGEFSLPRGFGVAPLLEVRDGFPLSIVDEHLDFVGARNRAGRFPLYFSLDVQGWKRVTLPWPRHLEARVGLKVFNVTNHFNPRDFDGNLASSQFGGFSSGVSRTLRGKFVIDF